jgi:hypothetical protein
MTRRFLAEPDVTEYSFSQTLPYHVRINDATMLSILLAHPQSNPAMQNNLLICVAATYNCISVATVLLCDGRVDPAVRNNAPLRIAVARKSVGVLALLLADPRVDPTAKNHEAIQKAARGQTNVMKVLLACTRVDPTVYDYAPLRMAISCGFHANAVVLLADARVNPARLATAEEWLAANPPRRTLRRR